MAMYALATVPLANACSIENLGEVWLADDASASGKLKLLFKWWNNLRTTGPLFGYFPNAEKTWLVVHPEHFEEARLLFDNTGVQISTDGRRELGSPLGIMLVAAHLMRPTKGFVRAYAVSGCTYAELFLTLAPCFSL